MRALSVLAALPLVSAVIVGDVPAAWAADPVGHYACEGRGPNGAAYEGTVDVTQTGETYQVIWLIGSDKFVGTAIGNSSFLAVSYRSGSNTGLALYGEDGSDWVGPWTYAGGNKLGAERWTRK